MQNPLFDGPDDIGARQPAGVRTAARGRGVLAAPANDEHRRLATELPAALRIGSSSWNYPGWKDLVWADDYDAPRLSKMGLTAYAQHPLLRTVCLDRAFYRPLSSDQYRSYAAQVPAGFRFVIKAPSVVADALIRSEDGRGLQINDRFLDPELAVSAFVEPALTGLGDKLGALVFQLSPMPSLVLARAGRVLDQLGVLLRALPDLRGRAPDAVVAVEFRDPLFLSPGLTPQLAQTLRHGRATYCLGLHAKMPPIEDQLPMLRACWPGPLVCRWNLHRKHGAYGYEDAKRLYGGFDRIVDADPETRHALARVIAGTTAAGYSAYVTIGNKAEGSAPRSVVALAEAVVAAAR